MLLGQKKVTQMHIWNMPVNERWVKLWIFFLNQENFSMYRSLIEFFHQLAVQTLKYEKRVGSESAENG